MRFFYFQELGEFEKYFSLSKSISVLISELIRIIQADISATTDKNYNVCIFISKSLLIPTYDIIIFSGRWVCDILLQFLIIINDRRSKNNNPNHSPDYFF